MLLIDVLNGKKSGRVPVWMMRQAGRYLPEYREVRAKAGSFLDLCYNPALACEVTLQPIRRFGFDAAILFSDILVIPDALGQKVAFLQGEGPKLEPVADRAGLARLSDRGLLSHLAPVFDTVGLLREKLPAETALIGFCGAPWTVATYMVAGEGSKDQEAARRWAYREPDAFQALIDLITTSSIAYLSRQVEAGVDALQIFDSWAGSLPEAEFERWCLLPLKRIVEGVKARHPSIPVIGFPRGAGPSAIRVARESGITGLSVDTAMPLGFVRDMLQPLLCVQGNLDPLLLATGGAALEQGVDRILQMLGQGPFIFNLGHGIVPDTPPDHVGQVVDRIRAWRG